MPVPSEYQRASLDFERFLLHARQAGELQTTHMAWNMVVGVLHTFRARLTVPQVAAFANVLPPVLRALFIEGWDPAHQPCAFNHRSQLLAEIRSLRAAHNFSPDNAIEAVSIALRASVDEEQLQRVLRSISAEAFGYWYFARDDNTHD